MGLFRTAKVWRGGANENTTISFSDPVTIEGSHSIKERTTP
jgi:hypothetical protein